VVGPRFSSQRPCAYRHYDAFLEQRHHESEAEIEAFACRDVEPGLGPARAVALREIEKILLKLPPERRINLIEDLQQRRNAQKAALHNGAA
jgi:hypothetical protein